MKWYKDELLTDDIHIQFKYTTDHKFNIDNSEIIKVEVFVPAIDKWTEVFNNDEIRILASDMLESWSKKYDETNGKLETMQPSRLWGPG